MQKSAERQNPALLEKALFSLEAVQKREIFREGLERFNIPNNLSITEGAPF